MSPLLRSFLVMACVVAVSARSQTPAPPSASDFLVREWHGEDGLPHEDVLQVLQDGDGYLWVACRGALCRFDGTTFMTEAAPETRDVFLTMAEERDGSLLLTPREGDPLRYRNGKYTREPLPAPYTGRAVGVRFTAPDGAQWYSVRGAVLRVSAGEVQAFEAQDGIVSQNWTRFAVDLRGRVWLANNRFLARYENGRLVRVPVDADTAELRVVSSRSGGPWLVTPNQVLKFNADDQAVEVAPISTLLGAHYVNTAIEDRNGRLWLGTRSEGLHAIGPDRHFHVPTSSDTIMALFEDREGTLWVGASSGGLSAVARKVYTLYNKSSGLAATAVSAVCTDEAGDIWLANGDGGVARIHGTQVDRWILRSGTRTMAAGAVSRHPGGGVWAMGGNGAAVFLITDKLGEASVVSEVPGGTHATMFTARNGDLWLATADRRVGRLQGQSYQLYGPAEGVPATGVRTFAETAAGEILLGTNEGTLLRFDGTRFAAAPGPVFQASSAINSILPVGDGLWLGTAANGLLICQGNRTVSLGTAHGLPDGNITQMMPDAQGNVWCASSRGVFRVAIAEVERLARGEIGTIFPLRLGKDEGLGTLTSQGIYGPGVAKSLDGRIWFATRQGVLAVDPVAEALTPPPPTARIEQILADETPRPLTRPWIVDPNARKLELRFSVLCLSAPSRVQPRYRLAGFDTGWVHSRPGVAATYPRLPPGTYRFEVAAGFGNGSASPPTDVLEIVVPPLWWQSVWVRLGGVALGVGGITLMVRAWSHRRLRRRIENLEQETAIARVRERIARDIHDDVGASLTRISLLTQTSSPHSPEAENLNRIDETAREVTRSLDEIVWAVDPHHDTLESFISYLTDFAQKFLGAARIRCRLLIPATLPSIPLPSETRHDLFLCCRETLNNIIKHAGASEVTIRLTFTDPTLVITIADDGRGLAAEKTASPAERISSGHGLVNLRQRMDRIGGSCVIESPVSGGTSVTLTVSLRRSVETPL